MARLVIFDDQVRGVVLPDRPVMIGRSLRNDIPINDGLLSRKHCSIVPVGERFRLVDLKSSNGTFLNGQRAEREVLEVDDIIEIGDTVMVFLEEDVWSRGDGLARLRNPIKAQELIGRIRLHHARKGARIPHRGVRSRAASGEISSKRTKRPSRRAAALKGIPSYRDLSQAIEDFIVHRAALIISRDTAPLRRLVAGILREVLAARPGPAGAPGDSPTAGGEAAPSLRAIVRQKLEQKLPETLREIAGRAAKKAPGDAPKSSESSGAFPGPPPGAAAEGEVKGGDGR